MESKPEFWQSGPIENVPALLQPVAHALLQAREEVHNLMNGFPEDLLWERPADVASPAFHLQHLTGVINRLFTYARKDILTKEQYAAMAIEGKKEETTANMHELIATFDQQVDAAIEELKTVDTEKLTEARGVGRKQIPTTLIGLYFHAAEHSMRHVGQLLVTTRVLKGGNS